MISKALKLQGWKPAYDQPRNLDYVRPDGVSTPGWFNFEVWFSTFQAAVNAEPELRGAGYVFEILDEIDDYSDATFTVISKPAGTATLDDLFDQASKLAEQLGGDADGAWISGETYTRSN
jgi:hypothetical protein